jgi:hypothetical protein
MATQDIDRGWRRIQRELKKMDGSFTKVGIQGGSEKMTDRELPQMVMIGAVHEFGAPRANVPARPYFRWSFDNNLNKLKRVQKRAYNGVLDGDFSTEQGLGLIGQFMESRIKKRITDVRTPPLKNPSLRRTEGRAGLRQSRLKKRSVPNPLVDTGQLRASIIHTEHVR